MGKYVLRCLECGLRVAERSTDPIIEVTRAIPPLAWIPFAIAWLGCTHQAAGFIVFIGAVFPVLLNTYAGFRSVDRIYIDAARVLGCKTNASLIKSVAIPCLSSQRASEWEWASVGCASSPPKCSERQAAVSATVYGYPTVCT